MSMKQILVMMAVVVVLGCEDESIGGYVAASSFSKKGFAKNRKEALALRGKALKVWGYVDGGNVFPKDSDHNHRLPETWSFKLKAKPNDQVGQSFPIIIPADDGHDKLAALFWANHLAGKPTRVFVTGTISTFEAPMNFVTKTGLVMKLNSSKDISLKTPTKE